MRALKPLTFLLAAACVLAVNAQYRGAVVFDNRVSDGTSTIVDAPFFDYDGVPLAGSNYVAQLFGGESPGTMVPCGTSVVFISNGYFRPYDLEVPSRHFGGPTWVRIHAWHASGGETYEAAVAAGVWTGVSTLLHLPSTGTGGSPPSLPAYLLGLEFVPSVNPALPGITNQPMDQIVSTGEPVKFEVGATNGPLNYQWRFNFVLSGETNSSLSILSANTNHFGVFDVVVSNPSGSITSQLARLEVYPNIGPPVLRYEPLDQNVQFGETTAFRVAATGAQPISYQWYRGLTGDPSDPISGAANSTYVPPRFSQAAVYWVRATNPTGAANSRTAALRVFPEKAARLTARLAARHLGVERASIHLTLEGIPFMTYHVNTISHFTNGWAPFVSFTMPSSPFSFTYGYSLWRPELGFYRAATQ